MRRLLPLLLLLAPLRAEGFDPQRDVRIQVVAGVLTLSLPEAVHLKVRTFRVALLSKGVLTRGPLPEAPERDEAGDPILRGTLRVRLAGRDLEEPARLQVTFQPCTEGPSGVCFLPQKRTLAVAAGEIPAEAPEAR
jgi:hypothetical protein